VCVIRRLAIFVLVATSYSFLASCRLETEPEVLADADADADADDGEITSFGVEVALPSSAGGETTSLTITEPILISISKDGDGVTPCEAGFGEDILCVVEMFELDMFFHAFSLVSTAPKSLCDYRSFIPSFFSIAPVADSPTGVAIETNGGLSEESTIQTVADSSGSLTGAYFLYSTPLADYYIWMNVGIKEVSTITTVADSIGSLAGTHFLYSTPSTDHYVWMNVGTRKEVSTITTVADSSGSLGGKYFTYSTPSTDHYVWMNVGAEPEVSSITAVEDVGGSLGGKYFTYSTPPTDHYVWMNVGAEQEVSTFFVIAGGVIPPIGGSYFLYSTPSTDYYVWFDIADGSMDPNVSGRTGIEVDILPFDSSEAIALAIRQALNQTDGITATVSGFIVTATSDTGGNTTNLSAGNTAGAIFLPPTSPIEGLDGSTDPAPTGRVGIEVNISADDSAADVAQAIKSALSSTDGITATVSGSEVTATNDTGGDVTDAADVNTPFTIAITQGLDGSTDPAPSGRAGIEVNITADDSATDVASAVQAAMNSVSGITATISGSEVTATNDTGGNTTNAADVNTSFSVAVATQGVSEGSDPALPSRSGIEVNISADASAVDVALAVKLAMDAVSGITATVSSDEVTATNDSVGNVTNVAAGTSGFAVAVVTPGVGGTADPAIGGKTGIEVIIILDDSAEDVAATVQAAMNAVSDITATVLNDLVTATNNDQGDVTDIAEGGAATLFTFDRVDGITPGIQTINPSGTFAAADIHYFFSDPGIWVTHEVLFGSPAEEESDLRCLFDYSKEAAGVAGGKNCCYGSYTLIKIVDGETKVTFPGWGGQVSNCFDGPAIDHDGRKIVNGLPTIEVTFVPDDGLKDTFEVTGPDQLPPGQQRQVYAANFFKLADHGGDVPGPFKLARNFYSSVFLENSGSFLYECIDQADEVIARIRVMAQEWNTKSELLDFLAGDDTADPNVGGTEAPPTKTDSLPSNDSGEFNDAPDWKDREGFGLDYKDFGIADLGLGLPLIIPNNSSYYFGFPD